ncbi:transposase family protein [Eubacteriales bacterium OttesenSCG-928-A19]|nr:transposase family protein [Eubacteriales bacterium OttesenSCG-928-A19]
MKKEQSIREHFGRVETTQDYAGYRYNIGEALTVMILGSLCGLQNTSQIHQWAESERVSTFLCTHFEIVGIPCYYWLLCLLKMINPESPSQCFTQWVQTMLPEER